MTEELHSGRLFVIDESLLHFSHRDNQSMVALSIGLLYVINTMNDSLDEPNDVHAI